MLTEKNKWVEDVLASADHLRFAKGPDLTASILSRADGNRISTSAIWRIAASVILLIGLNVSALFIYNGAQHAHGSHSQDMATALGLGAGDDHADLGHIFFEN